MEFELFTQDQFTHHVSKPGPWEAFENHTHNGRYWAVKRLNSKWLGGKQTMLTKGHQPRRFGSESAAAAAAKKANELVMQQK